MGQGEDRLAAGGLMSSPIKHAASLEEIAKAEGISVAAAHMVINRALRKLRNQRLLLTLRELAQELDRNRRESVE
jgi:hypothetical protein